MKKHNDNFYFNLSFYIFVFLLMIFSLSVFFYRRLKNHIYGDKEGGKKTDQIMGVGDTTGEGNKDITIEDNVEKESDTTLEIIKEEDEDKEEEDDEEEEDEDEDTSEKTFEERLYDFVYPKCSNCRDKLMFKRDDSSKTIWQ